MAGTTYQVKPGAPQQLTGSVLPAGAVIVNNDSAVSVWISSDQTVTPGLGIELTPFAKASWAGKQVWACVDTGVLTPISLTISDDVTDIDNPVAVATAVATALLAQGIPTVLIEDNLFSAGLGVGADTGKINVSKYSSLIINFNLQAFTGVRSLTYEFFDDQGILCGTNNISFATSGAIPTVMLPVIIPVTGRQFRLTNTVGGVVTLVNIDGTNRPVDRYKLLFNTQNFVNGSVAGAPFVVGTSSSIGALICNGQQMTISCIVTANVVKGLFTLTDSAGGQISVADTTEMHLDAAGNQTILKNICVPVGSYLIQFDCRGTGGNATAFFRAMANDN